MRQSDRNEKMVRDDRKLRNTLMNIKTFAIYGIGKFIPDHLYVNLYYYKKFHTMPNLKNPKSFNEKLTWMKIYDRNPQYTQMVDKYAAKGYVEKIIGGGIPFPRSRFGILQMKLA